MIRYPSRPQEGRLAFEQRTALLELELHAAHDAGGTDHVSAFIDANELWQTGVKAYYMAYQGRTCGFCERKITDVGDVEHYRPKKAIYILDPERPGVELESLNNIRGRVFLKPPTPGCHASGYWWLAYSWDNYLVACGTCNQRWKGALFPIEGGHQGPPSPGDELHESPLLLNPYGTIDPTEHLAFNDFGVVEGLTEVGRTTIATLGLDRNSLTSSREEKARQTWLTLKKIEVAVDAGQSMDVRGRCRDLVTAGTFGNAHAGMVRCIAVQKLRMTWSAIENLAL